MKIDPKKYYFCYSATRGINWEEDIDINDSIINYVLNPGDNDIDFIDKVRKGLGYTDLASSTDNEVYYNFYLEINLETDERVVKVVVNHSEKDDFAEYEFECGIHCETFEAILRKTLLKTIKGELI